MQLFRHIQGLNKIKELCKHCKEVTTSLHFPYLKDEIDHKVSMEIRNQDCWKGDYCRTTVRETDYKTFRSTNSVL